MADAAREPGWVPEDTFASRLRWVRQDMDLTVEDAAVRCAIPPATWSSWEAGRHPREMHKVVAKINRALGVDRDWLMWGSQNFGYKRLERHLAPVPGQGKPKPNAARPLVATARPQG